MSDSVTGYCTKSRAFVIDTTLIGKYTISVRMSDTSTLFELLAADHRRRLLILLCKTDSIQIPEGLLTRGTRARTNGPPQESSHKETAFQHTPTDEDALEVQLVHCHLPKLEDADVIEWDRETQTVTRGPAFAEIEPFLSLLIGNADKFPHKLL